MLAGLTLHFWYWQQIDRHGRTVTCKVDRKNEFIDRQSRSDAWSHGFRVTLECPYVGGGTPMFPRFDTDEQEFDRIQHGAPFAVKYLDVPIGLVLLGVVPAHLERETFDIHLQSVLARFKPLLGIAAYVAVLAMLVLIVTKSKRRVPGARWVLFGVLAVGIIYVLTPTLPATVSGRTQQATATVKELHVFKRLLGSSRSRGIDASTPYELAVVQFVPAGRHEPVLAADMIDIASQKDLAVGQQVAIDYETDHPRRANIRGGTRAYYRENVQGAILSGFATVALFVGATLAWEALKRRGKQAVEAARERARDRAL